MKIIVQGQICSSCETGKQTYMLDPREPFCPYLHLNNGIACNMYEPLKKEEQVKNHKEEYPNEKQI